MKLRHKTSTLSKTRISSSPSVSLSPAASVRDTTPPQSLTRRHGQQYNQFGESSLPPSQSLASFLSGHKGDGVDEEEERMRLKREERFQAQRASLRRMYHIILVTGEG
jgi:hypothetical protein